MRFILLLAGFIATSPVFAADAVPDRRAIVTRNVDFYGSDLQPIFDTTYATCETACLAQPQCKAFTFNGKSKACFPKTDITDRQPYDGAWSARIVETAPSLLSNAEARADQLGFLGEATLSAAHQQALKIGWTHPAGQYQVADLIQAAQDRRRQGDHINAMRWMGGAVSHTDAADQWLSYADLSLLAAQDTKDAKSRYRKRALYGAVNAYLRTSNDALSADALRIMAEALEATGNGRLMIPTLRLAQEKQPNWPELASALDNAIGKYGFRITDHNVESNAAAPRFCAVFSDPLKTGDIDYTPFVALPNPGMAVTASGNELCVDGLSHGQRYSFTFREGIPAQSGERTQKDVELSQYVRDREPSLRFPGRAYVLPRTHDAALPIETVNLERVDLVLRRVSDRNLLRAMQDNYFARPLSYWERDDFAENIAEEVWRGSGHIEPALNRSVTTRLPLVEAIADQPAGIYALSAQKPGHDFYDDPDHTQWFVLSDLGVATLSGTDGLHVFVRSLQTAAPLDQVTATLVSRSNRVLGKVNSDANGYARFEPGLTRGTGAAAPAMLLVERGAEDMSFLSLTDPAFDLSDRGVEGRAPSPALDVFLTTERGAYRAGDTIYATALVRDGIAAAVDAVPLTAILTRPDGVEYSRHLSDRQAAGGHVFAFPLGDGVPRGAWRLEVKADVTAPALATQKLLVEDFLPERIDVTIGLPEGILDPLAQTKLSVQADYLFGAPAADLRADALVRLRQAKDIPGFTGYHFGRADDPYAGRTFGVDLSKTDKTGLTETHLTLGDSDSTHILQAEVIASVAEGSGRPVERSLSRVIAPRQPVIGIKPLFDGVAAEGSDAQLQVIALDPQMQPTDMPVKWTLNRVTTRYQWYQQWGDWRWEPITTRKPVADGGFVAQGQAETLSVPVEWGNYELVVTHEQDGSIASSYSFYAGWFAPADAGTTPDMLSLSLDKPSYREGETARLRMVPRYAGKALISVMSNRLITMKAVEVTQGENLVDLPVTADWGAGAYVTATVIRPMDAGPDRNPARSLGLSYAQVDPGQKHLDVSLDLPLAADPRGTLNGSVQIDGLPPGEEAFVTIAAVDEGILNLTGFTAPDPSGHYFGQRRLGMEIRDLYGRLIDTNNGALGVIRSGGDAGRTAQLQAPPPTEELLAFFTGPIAVDAAGRADFDFDLPAFNGSVKVMAIAWSPTAVGQADQDVLVRDPVVVTSSLPRFLSPGDQSRLLLEIVHASGPTGRFGLDVTAQGVTLDAAVPSGLTLGDKETAVLTLPLSADQEGDHSLRVALTTPDGRQLVKTLTLGVRNNDPLVSTTQRFSLAAGSVFTLDSNAFANLRPGTGSAVISAGPLAQFNAPALLAALDRYPYGCTEQVTSQAMPLLYFNEVSTALGLGDTGRIRQRIDQAVERVLTRQSTNGAFGLWRPGSGDLWLDAYVSDFLSRARAEGFAIPDRAFRMSMDNLRNRVNYAPDFDTGGADLAYALMVLAREGVASMGDLRYYADVKEQAFSSPLALAQLGSALALYGDQTRADRMFALAAKRLSAQAPDAALWRADYGTNLRDAAGVLALAVESGSAAVPRDPLVQRLQAASGALSTQEQVWALMAARALVTEPSLNGLTVNGVPVEGPFARSFSAELAQQPLELRNTTTLPTDITLTITGVPAGPTQEGGYGYRITRSYFTQEGEAIRPDAVTIRQRMVVVLEVTPFDQSAGRLMINDPLPAGFEIDNPNLLRQGDVRGLDWLSPSFAEHSEFRSDRFLTAVDATGGNVIQLAYQVRAISPGEFHHPAASVEDMYRPQYRAQTASGRVRISE